MPQAKLSLILLVGLVATGPALAETYSINLKPPAAAIAKGRAAKPIVLYVRGIDAFCRAGGARSSGHILACQGKWKADGRCIIILPSHAPALQLTRLHNHELAHCGGWRHD